MVLLYEEDALKVENDRKEKELQISCQQNLEMLNESLEMEEEKQKKQKSLLPIEQQERATRTTTYRCHGLYMRWWKRGDGVRDG